MKNKKSWVGRVFLAGAVLATGAGLFYTVENWRGRRAWEGFKAEAAKRGVVTHWLALVPPAVPDDQNFFAAPHMQEWFTGRGVTEFSKRINVGTLDEILLRRGVMACVDVAVVRADESAADENADLVLRYNHGRLSAGKEPAVSAANLTANRHVKITAEALRQIINTLKPGVESFNQEITNEAADLPKVSDVDLRAIGVRPLAVFTPLRVVLRADTNLSPIEIGDCFQGTLKDNATFGNLAGTIGYGAGIITTGSNRFRVSLGSAPYVPAADFVAWSDGFSDLFEQLRVALERPYARMGGDYGQPSNIPIPNFVCARLVAQLVAKRAQAYLLLNEPGKALKELTLLHRMTRMFEGRPTGRPMTLIAAMINVAVRGLYTTIVNDGLKLHGWRAADLAVIERQLAETDLLPYVRDAFQCEGLAFGGMAETASAKDLAEAYMWGDREKGWWVKAKNPEYVFIRVAPHGWLLQNALKNAEREVNLLPNIDVSNHVIVPEGVETLARGLERDVNHRTPYTFLSSASVPNFVRALQTTGRNQTLVNEGMVACALERYRLAKGNYPETLAALVPEFAEKLPVDVIGGGELQYRVEDGKYVLYSVGWNGKDDAGVAGAKGKLDEGDWVWE